MIYHYTSVDTLSLILQSNRIRFNRLDRVRDLSEARTSQGVEFGTILFVSCWSCESVESIPLWEISALSFTGVRIGLPDYPFKLSEMKPPDSWNWVSEGEVLSPIPFDEVFTDSHLILPAFLDRSKFAGDVQYVDDIQKAFDSAVSWRSGGDGCTSLQIRDPFSLARMKSKYYAFEKEYRFVLVILPGLPIPADGPGNPEYTRRFPNHLIQCLQAGKGPDLQWLDVELDAQARREMEIVVGPCVSAGQQQFLDRLKREHGFQMRQSDLSGTIRCP